MTAEGITYEQAEKIVARMPWEMVWMRARVLLEPPPPTTERQCPCCEGAGHLGDVLRRCPVCRGWAAITEAAAQWFDDAVACQDSVGRHRATVNQWTVMRAEGYRPQKRAAKRIRPRVDGEKTSEERYGVMGEMPSAMTRRCA